MNPWRDVQQRITILLINNPLCSKFIRFIDDNPLYNGALVLGSGAVLAQAIGVLSMLVITRLYSPSDFGIYTLFSSFLAIVVGVASLRYEFAFPLINDDKRAANLLALCLIILIGTSAGFTFILLSAGVYLVNFFQMNSLAVFMWLLIVGFFGIGLYTILNYWAIRQRDYTRITYTRINQSISGAGCKILLGAFSFGPIGLIIGNIIGQMAGIGTFARALWKTEQNIFKNITFAGIKSVAKEYWHFPAFNCPGLLISTISLQIPPLILVALYDTQIVGFFTLAQALLVFPTSIISASVAQAFHGDIGMMVRQGSNELKAFYIKTVKHLTLVALPLIGISSLLAPFVVPIIFGDAWGDAGWYCLPLALMVIPGFIAATTNKLDVYGYNHWVLMINIIQILFVLCGFYLCNLLELPVLLTLTIYALIMLSMYVAIIVLNLKAISNVTRSMRSHTDNFKH